MENQVAYKKNVYFMVKYKLIFSWKVKNALVIFLEQILIKKRI